MKKEIFEWFIAILVSVVCVILIKTFLFQTYTVSGNSMYPTFHDRDKVIVNKITNTFHNYERGDVVVLHADSNTDYIKRLIGKPGDQVEYKNDVLYINNKKVEEPYLSSNKKNKYGNELTEDFSVKDIVNSDSNKIKRGHYLVLGDNRQNSSDSRMELGLVNEKKLVGSVILRFWPIKDFNFNFYPSTFDAIND